MALHDYLAQEIAIDCAEGILSRREALRRLLLLGLSTPAAGALLAACASSDPEPNSAPAGEGIAPVPTDPSTTNTSAADSSAPAGTGTPAGTGEASPGAEIRFAGPRGELIGVLAEAGQPAGAVLIIHENRGLTPHIASLPPRFAADGYTALAIDLLSEEGGTAALGGDGEATAALGAASDERLIADLRAGLDELERRAPGLGLAVIGFCFGGGMAWQLLAAGEERLRAAAPFYGPAPSGADFSGSSGAAVLAVYAGLDDRVNASREGAQAALEAAGMEHEILTIDGVDHAFFNDTGARYDEAAAARAYRAVLDWFGVHLA